MKALSTLKSAIDQSSFAGIIALVLLTPVLFPQLASAAALQTSGQLSAQVFEIKVADSSLLDSTPKPNDNKNSISISDIASSDPLVISLNEYLYNQNSPLAGFADKIISYPHWQRALGISLVESHMCQFTPKVKTKKGWVESYNCSGIGGNNYRIYQDYLGWFADMNNLLDKPNYINRPIEKFIGYYVQPGSRNWLYGVKKVEAQLSNLEEQAQAQRQEMAQIHSGPITTALATFPENTN
jgi:hypothetical protein